MPQSETVPTTLIPCDSGHAPVEPSYPCDVEASAGCHDSAPLQIASSAATPPSMSSTVATDNTRITGAVRCYGGNAAASASTSTSTSTSTSGVRVSASTEQRITASLKHSLATDVLEARIAELRTNTVNNAVHGTEATESLICGIREDGVQSPNKATKGIGLILLGNSRFRAGTEPDSEDPEFREALENIAALNGYFRKQGPSRLSQDERKQLKDAIGTLFDRVNDAYSDEAGD